MQVSIDKFQEWHDWSRGIVKKSVVTEKAEDPQVVEAAAEAAKREGIWRKAFAPPVSARASVMGASVSRPQSSTAQQRLTLNAKSPSISKTMARPSVVSLKSSAQLIARHVVNTYLQLVGRELLTRAMWLVPLLQELPCVPPTSTLAQLFVLPFVKALSSALDALLTAPASYVSAYVDEAAMDQAQKTYQHLRVSSAVAKATAVGAVRSPMSLLSYLYDDGVAFFEALRAALKPLGAPLMPAWCARVLDAPFLERLAAVEALITGYVTRAFEVRP